MIDVNELIKSALKNKSQIELNVYRSIKGSNLFNS